jgi:hypothetical protein
MLKYFINLDERGEFYADVRRDDKTIFEIKGFEIFEDGFMKNKLDLAGLTEYLNDLGLIKENDGAIQFGN